MLKFFNLLDQCLIQEKYIHNFCEIPNTIEIYMYLQFLMSEMKTERPRIPSPFTAGIMSGLDQLKHTCIICFIMFSLVHVYYTLNCKKLPSIILTLRMLGNISSLFVVWRFFFKHTRLDKQNNLLCYPWQGRFTLDKPARDALFREVFKC